jgi:protein-tyrosine-phosphatase
VHSTTTVTDVKILAVCTANICRSPSIEWAVRHIAASREVSISAASAGTRTSGGRPADPDTVAVARKRGIAMSSHVSQGLTAEMIDQADLVLCAELEHLGRVLAFREDALAKSFLFLEFIDVVTIRHDGDDVVAWLDKVGRHRTAASVLGNAGRYNLADPYQRGRRKHQAALDLITEGADRVVEAWAG